MDFMGVLESNIIAFLPNQQLIFPEAPTVEGFFWILVLWFPLLCLIKIGFLILDVFFSALNKKQVLIL